jgi:Domain of unknown function (DUF4167)
MNNRQTNRRRGRGNNRAQNNNRNGYDHQNRIDNRARGNAAQMLEKYKKLAQDAQLNGDRVQAEYYHQFADHYFRVLADFRGRQEENRAARGDWRHEEREGHEERDWNEDERDSEDAVEEAEVVSEPVAEEDYDRRPQRRERNDRNDRNPRGRNNNRRERYEPREQLSEQEEAGLDLSILPPSIGVVANDEQEEPVAEKRPARKPRTRKPKASDEETVAAAE